MPAREAPATPAEIDLEREIERLRGWLEHIGEQAGATFIEKMVNQALHTDSVSENGLMPRDPRPSTPPVHPLADQETHSE